MVKSSILIDLDDPRTSKIADVISNKTTKKILSSLTESELTKTQLSKALELPLNTVEYNINKLEEAGLIEKVKDFFWSVKGKRINRYKLSDKKIIISPKSMIRGVIPALIISIIIAFALFLMPQTSPVNDMLSQTAEKASSVSGASQSIPASNIEIAPQASILTSNSWTWFLLGALASMLIFLLWNALSSRKSTHVS